MYSIGNINIYFLLLGRTSLSFIWQYEKDGYYVILIFKNYE